MVLVTLYYHPTLAQWTLGINRKISDFINSKKNEKCFEMLPCISNISGSTFKDQLQGKIDIVYQDGSRMEAIASSGVVHGKVLIFNSNKKLQAIGLYKVWMTTYEFVNCNGFEHLLVTWKSDNHF